jgi:hypothetical protein
LQSKHRSVKYWSAQISQLFADKRLIIPLKNLLLSDDCDTKIAAVTALSQIEDIQILSILEEAKDNESDEEVCEFLEEVISDLKDN